MNLRGKNYIYNLKALLHFYMTYIYIYRTFKHILILVFNTGDAVWWIGCLPIVVLIYSYLITSVFGIWYWTNKHNLSISNWQHVKCFANKMIENRHEHFFKIYSYWFQLYVPTCTCTCMPYVNIQCPIRKEGIGSP